MIPLLLAFLLAGEARATTIIHTNDVMGELEPCGCRSNPQGGIARKANLLKRLSDRSVLQLDGGDLLFGTDTVPALLARQSELQASYLLKAHELLGQDAVVPGEKDFALGFKVFEKIRKKTPIHFLAANLKRGNGARVFESHAIFKRKDENGKNLRIGVFGLVGDELSWPKELKATAPIPAAKAEVKELRKKVDLLIALTHEGYEKDAELAKAVPGIDMVIGGHTQTFLQKPVKIGSTWIYQSSFRNQYVGVIPLATRNDPETYKLVGLDVGYDSAADAQGDADRLVKKFKEAVAELNSREEAKQLAERSKDVAADPNRPKFQTFARCAECHLKQFEFWRQTRHAAAFHPLIEKQQNKNKDCLSCHSVGLGDAKGFTDINRLLEISPAPGATKTADSEGNEKIASPSHEETDAFLLAVHGAKDLKTLVKLPSRIEPLPLKRAIATLSHAWTPVQCENCHGPGLDHPFGAAVSRKVENTTCLKCHTPDKAPEWYNKTGQPDLEKIAAKRALVTCPAGELNPEETE